MSWNVIFSLLAASYCIFQAEGLTCFTIRRLEVNGQMMSNTTSLKVCKSSTSCAYVSMEMSMATGPASGRSSSVIGECISSASCSRGCNAFVSPVMLESPGGNISLENCQMSCCDTDLCNDHFATEAPIPETPIGATHGIVAVTPMMPLGVVMSTVSDAALAGDSSSRANLRCWIGTKIVTPFYKMDSQNLTECVGSDNSCLDIVASSSGSIVGTVRINYGLCMPTAACSLFNCDQLQNMMGEFAITECSAKCCNTDGCNTGSQQSGSSSTAAPVVTTTLESVSSDDIPFLRGCSFQEFYNNAWFCNINFFNEYPYSDETGCSRSADEHQRCHKAVIARCMVGNKPTFAAAVGSFAGLEQKMTESLENTGPLVSGLYGAMCSHNGNFVDQIRANLTGSSILGGNEQLANICDLTQITSNLDTYLRYVKALILSRDDATFCRSFKQLYTLSAEMYRGICDFSSFISSVAGRNSAAALMLENLQKMLDSIPSLLAKSEIPKCRGTNPFQEDLPPGIQLNNMDIMFLIDGSGSISRDHFKELMLFLKKIVARIDLVNNKVGVIQYTHWYAGRPLSQQEYLRTEISLGQFTSLSLFNSAADNIVQQGYTTYTAHAIQKAVLVDLAASDRFNDTCTKKVIAVITDGRSSDHEALNAAIAMAHQNNVQFLGIGVENYNFGELQIIAGPDHVFVAPTYDGLLQQVSNIQSALFGILEGGEC